eukprot:GAFH01000969.1.p1 GENE.GAFH01000969.1~~GAFH01000969.1.p1  ORF type:complete len:491 (-),score=142.81 GAFH01000969.1:767-2038(-)
MPFMGTHSIDDFESGTRCAIAGGTTHVIDFMIPPRTGSLLETYRQWAEKSQGKAYCDYGFHACVTAWNDKVAKELAVLAREHGVTSCKHFLAYKGSLMLAAPEVIASFTLCKQLGILPMVHAEDGEMVAHQQRVIFESGIHGPEGHPLSRPPPMEALAVRMSTSFAELVNCPIYIVHNSCREAALEIRIAQERGVRVIGEVIVAHLMRDRSACSDPDWDLAAAHVLSPPLRAPEDMQALWAALQAGTLTVTGSDHCAFTRAQKRAGKEDFRLIPNGMLGIEERMLAIWERGVNSGRISREEFVNMTSTAAARVFNLYPRKGAVAVGSDADLVVWDPALERVISARTHQSRAEINPLEGTRCLGAPSVTIVGGRLAYHHLRGVLARPDWGRYVPRPAFGSAFSLVPRRDTVIQEERARMAALRA